MVIKRDILLNKLIQAKSRNLIKILVGMRRCGKSFLLFNLFKQHLLDTGVSPDHIVEIDLEADDLLFCRDAITLGKEIRARLPADDAPCFVLIDEIQHAEPILPEGTDLSRPARTATPAQKRRVACLNRSTSYRRHRQTPLRNMNDETRHVV